MLLFGGLGEARRQNACLHCFLHLARFLNRLEQLTARLRLTADRMSTLCAQIVHKRTQTLFLVSHTFLPEQNATRAGRIKSIITQCLATGSSSKLSSCQSSLWLWNLQNPQSRVRQFYEYGRPQIVEIYKVPIYSASHTKQGLPAENG